MALLAMSGDWHGELGWGIAVLRAAKDEGASLLVQTGDFGFSWPGLDRVRAVDKLNKAAENIGLPVLFVRGNHDNAPDFFKLQPEPEGYAKLREWIWYLPDGARVEWEEGVTIGGLGGATSSDAGWRLEDEARRRKHRTLYWPEEVVDRRGAVRLMQGGPLDVLVSHDLPAGPWEEGYWRISRDPGFERSAMIDKEIIAGVREATTPRLHVFGHWHIRKSIDTGQPGHLLEGLGMNGHRLGNLFSWDSETNKITDLEVKWGPKK